MSVYFDSAYIAKCYVNEADSGRVRALLSRSGGGHSSSLARVEVAATVMRHVRERALKPTHGARLLADFASDVGAGVWTIAPVSDAFMQRVAARVSQLPATVYLRAGDAIHLQAASEGGFAEVWTNDRHMLAAAPSFGLQGRAV
ncbi:MAG TPA: type II toxin-antitoxin system VapC family toxin [Polyangia bacterium]|nr:type II toxin-antitoxin system VapC family toxin [Polyangia bacterium]